MNSFLVAVRSGLLFSLLAVFASGEQDADPIDKDAFGSRKVWHLTYTLLLKGKGEIEKPDKMGQSIKTSWNIHRELSGQAKLDKVTHGNGLAKALKTPLTGARGEKLGRFHSWSPNEWRGRSLSYRIHDWMRREVVGTGEGRAPTKEWEFQKIEDAGSLTFSDTGSYFACDVTDLLFDVSLSNIRNGLGGGSEMPRTLKITGERHSGGGDQEVPARMEQPGTLLPHGNDELWNALLGRTLELHKGKIDFTVSLPVTEFPSTEGQYSLLKPFKLEGGRHLDLSIHIVISPGPTSEAKLILKPEAGYGTWRPLCSDSEAVPGNTLKVEWRVEEEGGDRARPAKVKQLEFSLLNCSKLPGVCMNHPLTPTTPADFDLKFQPPADPKGPSFVSPDLQRLTLHGKLTAAGKGSIVLDCFDSGATGALVAEAELEDGRKLTSTVEGMVNPELLIPDHEPSLSLIAKDWRSRNASGKADDADDEKIPVGDGKAGDGLTIWEEYRGFWVNGAFEEGDPAKKDFFVRNEAGAIAEPGITKFETLSKLHMHRLAVAELNVDRVINSNFAERPHRVDQHGILIQSEPALGEFCQAKSRIPGLAVGTPKSIDYVGVGIVPTNLVQTQAGGTTTSEPYSAVALAHELFHCCNVNHHGEEPDRLAKGITWTKDAQGNLTEGAVKIRVLDTSGNDISGMVTFPIPVGPLSMKTVALFIWQGIASGDVGCVMRDDTALAYIPRGAPGDRVLLLPTEREFGGGLCTLVTATGTNLKPGRWGPCAKGRGNCAGQIRVNDDGDAPRRTITVIK